MKMILFSLLSAAVVASVTVWAAELLEGTVASKDPEARDCGSLSASRGSPPAVT